VVILHRRLVGMGLIALSLALPGCANSPGAASVASDDPAVERSYEQTGDLDCDQVSYGKAQALIADGDPHGLDRDGDGEACEANQ
jgi:hypothetical protein